jgi:hypothetical protein
LTRCEGEILLRKDYRLNKKATIAVTFLSFLPHPGNCDQPVCDFDVHDLQPGHLLIYFLGQ